MGPRIGEGVKFHPFPWLRYCTLTFAKALQRCIFTTHDHICNIFLQSLASPAASHLGTRASLRRAKKAVKTCPAVKTTDILPPPPAARRCNIFSQSLASPAHSHLGTRASLRRAKKAVKTCPAPQPTSSHRQPQIQTADARRRRRPLLSDCTARWQWEWDHLA